MGAMTKFERALPSIQRQIEEALLLVNVANKQHRAGLLDFEEIFGEAEEFYAIILAAICRLTDEEADAIEPKFTELELELSALSEDIQDAEDRAVILSRLN
jgi:hypothetical protein